MQHVHEDKVIGEIRLAPHVILGATARSAEVAPVRCPLCAAAVEPPQDQGPGDLACGTCGMTFPFASRQSSDPRQPQGPFERWLAGEPIQRRLPSGWERFRRWCAERPYLVGVTAVMLPALIAVAILSILACQDARSQLRQATQELEQFQCRDEPSSLESAAGDNPSAATRQPSDVWTADRDPSGSTGETPVSPNGVKPDLADR